MGCARRSDPTGDLLETHRAAAVSYGTCRGAADQPSRGVTAPPRPEGGRPGPDAGAGTRARLHSQVRRSCSAQSRAGCVLGPGAGQLQTHRRKRQREERRGSVMTTAPQTTAVTAETVVEVPIERA